MLFTSLSYMACDDSFNCSDRGNCRNGVCICQVQFAGENCTQTNIGYIAAFSSIFCALGLISIIQLVICIHSEYRRQKHPTVLSAFRVTTQKLLLGVVIAASITRILYFSLQGVIPEQWLIPMESAYHPILITGFSLVVCYWSEAFFLETVSVDASHKARFLSKSFVAFSVFNVVLYVMLLAHFVLTAVGFYSPGSEELWLNGAFQASFGIVLFVVYVIFLAIGVEIFFKVRGAFTISNEVAHSSSTDLNNMNKKEVFKSRLALVFQALLTLLTVLCVIFDAAGNLWKYKVNPSTRSTHEVIYRIAEVGAVLWFPCVLWNSTCPEKLWFLNPRCLLKLTGDAGERLLSVQTSSSCRSRKIKTYNTFTQPSKDLLLSEDISKEQGECWICYDPDRRDSGELITPCLCRGGMAQVHHNCLRTWLVQHPNVEEACCKVCKHRYSIEQRKLEFGAMLCQSKRATLMIPAIVIAVIAPCASVLVFLLCDTLETYVKVLVLGVTILLELVCFKSLGINFTKLYQVTRISALRILNYTTPTVVVKLHGISNDVSDVSENNALLCDVDVTPQINYDVIHGDRIPSGENLSDQMTNITDSPMLAHAS
ncbi:uncharacterized protein LOC143469098 [Clavelina lepadiformis]|uniref:RING-CH-type domain-containing protein n=1 Tax=Clavelina lepadiformis TaxID=159417 RepID=A0ABP0F606_CLALP